MLDAVIFVKGYFLSFRPHFKESSLGVPLAPDSKHQSKIHLAWMKSEIRRFASLSGDHDIFQQAKSTFLARLHRFMIPNMLTTVLQRYDPYLAYLYNKSVTHHDSFVNPTFLRPRCLPLVLRWAPELNCLSSLYHNIMASVDVQTALDDVAQKVFWQLFCSRPATGQLFGRNRVVPGRFFSRCADAL